MKPYAALYLSLILFFEILDHLFVVARRLPSLRPEECLNTERPLTTCMDLGDVVGHL